MSQRFQRNVEDFACEKCGLLVVGDGYTNHCPACLWSKHVDVHPGDRAAVCGGLMQPIGILIRGSEQLIAHECLVCKHRKYNKVAKDDDANTLVTLAAQVFE